MSRKSPGLSLRRIALALAAAEARPHALEMIARLAADSEAEVSAIFIEDDEMLRAARLPFALEWCRATNLVQRADSAEIERGLRARAAAARQLVARSAEATGARWSFEVVRQTRASAVLELARGTDVTMFATAAYRSQMRPASATRPPASRPSATSDSIVVLVDRFGASRRAMTLARTLAGWRQLPVHAVAIAATRAGLEGLSARLEAAGAVVGPRIHGLCKPQFDTVVSTVNSLHPAALVLPITLVEGAAERVRELEEAFEIPILIVK